MDQGYIKLHRKFFENTLWKEPREYSKAEAWLDLIQSARFESSQVILNGRVIEVQMSEVAASRRYLEKRWGWGSTKVNNFLDFLRKNQMITTKQTGGQTIITLCNYERYNGKKTREQTTDKPATNQWQTTDKPKEEKEKKEKNISTTTTAREDNIQTETTSEVESDNTSQKSSAQKVPPQVPDDVVEYIPIGEIAAYMKAKTQWLEAFCMNLHLDPEFVNRKIDEFAVECQNNGELEKDKADCIRHFNSWMRKVKQRPYRQSSFKATGNNRHPATNFNNDQHYDDF